MNLQNTDYQTLDELAEVFSAKISLLKSSLELRNLDEESCGALCPIKNQVAELKIFLQKIRNEMKVYDQLLIDMKAHLLKIDDIDVKVNHINKNFPDVLNTRNTCTQVVNNQAQFHSAVKVLPSNTFKKPRSVPKIQLITVNEFDSVPKYMKGRIAYSQINDFVDGFNRTIEAKYKLLSTPRNELKTSTYKMVQIMKSQENKETTGIYFCVGDDLKDLGKVKVDNPARNMLTILRHCCRTKEIRGPGAIVRYCVQE